MMRYLTVATLFTSLIHFHTQALASTVFQCGFYRIPGILAINDRGLTTENKKLMNQVFPPRLILFKGSLSEVSLPASVTPQTLGYPRFPDQKILKLGLFEVELTLSTEDSLEAKILKVYPLKSPSDLQDARKIVPLKTFDCGKK